MSERELTKQFECTSHRNGTASVIHIPFKQKAIDCAIGQFSHNNLPLGGGLGIYSDAAYREFGLL